VAELVGCRPDPPPPAVTPVLAELRAFDQLAAILAPLDKPTRGRLLRWARDRFLHDALDALEGHLRESCYPDGKKAAPRG